MKDLQQDEVIFQRYCFKEMRELIQNYNNYSLEKIDAYNVYFNGAVLHFDLYLDGKLININATNYIKKCDNGIRRIEGHIVKENVIFGFMKNDIRSIVVYNY